GVDDDGVSEAIVTNERGEWTNALPDRFAFFPTPTRDSELLFILGRHSLIEDFRDCLRRATSLFGDPFHELRTSLCGEGLELRDGHFRFGVPTLRASARQTDRRLRCTFRGVIEKALVDMTNL